MPETGRRPHITVVGDLILDRYLIGDATKLNPEMAGVVIRVEKEEDRLGGAAAVAMIAAGLGARVTLAGVVGRDESGDRLRRLIDRHNIESHLWTDKRPTTWKQRIVARGQLRPDRCDREVTTPISRDAEGYIADVPLGGLLLIPDYGKGVCTLGVLDTLGRRAQWARVPILVDPAQSRSWSAYGNVNLIKANRPEAMAAARDHEAHPLALARQLADEHLCHVVVTLGRHGMVCADREGAIWYLPAQRTEVRDVCGAGDTVLAALGLAMLAGSPLREASKLASMAASHQVSRLGIATVPPFCAANGDTRTVQTP